MLDVKLYEVFEEEQKALEQAFEGDLAFECTKHTIQESKDQELVAKVISVRTQSIIPLRWANNLDGILTRSQGFDHLSRYLQEAQSKIPCGYLPDYCARAVAEHAILMMMALLRKFKKQTKQFYQFKRDGITGFECKGRHVLVVGVGKIGSEIVDIVKGLSMEVRGVDCDPKNNCCSYVDLKEGMAWADIIFSAVPLTQETQGMFHYDLFKYAQKGCYFINISRGETAPFEGLTRLLEEQFLLGISLDVFEQEKLLAQQLRKEVEPFDLFTEKIRELAQKENVILTPHNAFNTSESVQRKAQQSAEAIKVFLQTNRFPFMVEL